MHRACACLSLSVLQPLTNPPTDPPTDPLTQPLTNPLIKPLTDPLATFHSFLLTLSLVGEQAVEAGEVDKVQLVCVFDTEK